MPRDPFDIIGTSVKSNGPWKDAGASAPASSSGPRWYDIELLPELTMPGSSKKDWTLEAAEMAQKYPKLDFMRRAVDEIGQGVYDSLLRPMSTAKNMALGAVTGGLGALRGAAAKVVGPTIARSLPGAFETTLAAASAPVAYDATKQAYYNPTWENVSNAGLAIGGTALAPLQAFRNLKYAPELPKKTPPVVEPPLPKVNPLQLPEGPKATTFIADADGNVVPNTAADKAKLADLRPIQDAEIYTPGETRIPSNRQLYPGNEAGTFIAGENGVQQIPPFERTQRVIPMMEDPGSIPLYHRSNNPNIEFGPVNPAATGGQVAKGTTHFAEDPAKGEVYGPFQTVRYTKSGNRFLDISEGEVTPELETAIRGYMKKQGMDDYSIEDGIKNLKNFEKRRSADSLDLNVIFGQMTGRKPGADFGFEMQETLGPAQNPNVQRRLPELREDAANQADILADMQPDADKLAYDLYGKPYENLSPKQIDYVFDKMDEAYMNPSNELVNQQVKASEARQLYALTRDTGFRDFLVDQGYDGVRYRGIDNSPEGTNAIGYGITRPQDLSKTIPQFPVMEGAVEATIGGLPQKGLQPFDPAYAQRQVVNDLLTTPVDNTPRIDLRTGPGRKKDPNKLPTEQVYAEVVDEPAVASAKAETIDPNAGVAADEVPPIAGKTKKGKTEPFNETLPGKMKVNTNPDDARMDWVGYRAAAGVYAKRVADKFKDFKSLGQAGIDAYEAGAKGFENVRKFMDDTFKAGVKAGIDMGYRDNYVSHLFQDDPKVVQQVFDRMVAEKPGFAKQRFFDTYKQAIAAGLTPKYDNLTDIVANYAERVYRAVADKKFISDLTASKVLSTKMQPGYTQLENFPVKGLNGRLTTFYAPDDLAKKINGYMKDADPTMKTIEAVGGFMKSLVLTGGVPNRAINSHAVSIAFRNAMMSENPLTGFKQAATYMFQPQKAGSFIDNNLKHTERAVQHGMTLGGEKVNFTALADEIRNTKFGDTKAGKLADRYLNTMQEVFEKPLFEQMLPALKIQKFLEFEDMLLREGLDAKTAARQAADMSNKTFGGINWDMKGLSRQKQSFARATMLAPDWLATQGYIAKDMANALLNPQTPVGQIYKRAIQNTLAMYMLAQYTNKATSGHWMHENDEGHQFQIEMTGMPGVKEGKKFYVTPFNTGMDFARIPFEIAQRIVQEYQASGNAASVSAAFDETTRQIGRRMNPMVSTAVEAYTNRDYRGNPIFSDEDRFGRPQDPVASVAGWAAGKLLPPFAEGGLRYWQDKTGPLEAIAESAELPARGAYPKPPR